MKESEFKIADKSNKQRFNKKGGGGYSLGQGDNSLNQSLIRF